MITRAALTLIAVLIFTSQSYSQLDDVFGKVKKESENALFDPYKNDKIETAPVEEHAVEARPAPRVNLAQALFSQAMSGGEPKTESFVAQEVTVNPNNLDIPAFLRRRRSIGDLKG